MHTFKPYSLRHSDLLYEDIPLEIREQIIVLIINALGSCSSFYDMTLYCYHNSHSDEVYRRICKTLRKEYGLFTLYAHSTSYLDEISNLLLKTDDKRKHIDAIELAFKYIDTYLRTYEVTLGLEPDKAISELNNIFHDHDLKYRYENGRIVRLRRIKRLKNIRYYLYSPGEYGFVEYDLMEAYNRLMLNDFARVVSECHAVFRRVLIRIHERKGIVYHEQDSLNTLMANLMTRGVISAEYERKFHFLSNVLESEIFPPIAQEKSHHHYVMMLRISEELACSIYYLTERSIFFLTQRAEEDDVVT
ncbi:hypothetical protein OD218_002272 [Salmonella enterica]|nr:hypothetical protein [Salmonella enterica]EJX3099910.1 hypothetical protein [Salmonella enterica]EJX3109988.1 hypothetical protein [Salmonella enterica]EJX3248557.1 hypothetical protein [Salmonella enterica]EJX3459286.1 hypothetical protein [Salmonella enterica]